MQHQPATAKEIAIQARKDEEETLRRGEVFESLLKHPGWALLQSIGSAQQQLQLDKLLDPRLLEEGKSVLGLDQFRKGMINGARLILATPVAVVEHRKEILKKRDAEAASSGRRDEDEEGEV